MTIAGAHTFGESLSAERPAAKRTEVTILIAIHPIAVTKSGIQHSLKSQDAICLEHNDRDVTFAASAASGIVVEIFA
jgi:hypothetical protein